MSLVGSYVARIVFDILQVPTTLLELHTHQISSKDIKFDATAVNVATVDAVAVATVTRLAGFFSASFAHRI